MIDRTFTPKPRSTALLWVIRLLAVIALSLSSYLAWKAFSTSPAVGCGGVSDCDEVLNSDWSKWLSIPVSIPGALVYLGILVASLWAGPRVAPRLQRRAWAVLTVLAVFAAGGAIWFTALQVGAVHHYCLYCLSIHACGLIIAGLIAVQVMTLPTKHYDADHRVLPNIRPGKIWLLVLIGVAGLGGLITGQALSSSPQRVLVTIGSPDDPPRPSSTTSPGPRIVSPWTPTPDSSLPKSISAAALPVFKLGKVNIELDPHEFPILGSADARVILALMGDYTCPNCRAFHPMINRIRQRYGAQLAIMVLPVPLESKCNPRVTVTLPEHVNACELAHIALAVWRARPDAFDQMDDWLFGAHRSRTPAEARAYASELVGPASLKKAEADPWVARMIRQTVGIYERGNGGTVPRLLFPSDADGAIHNEAELIQLLESSLKLVPPGSPSTRPSTAPTTQPAAGRATGVSTAPTTVPAGLR